MERELYNELLSWKTKKGHRPLLLTGAPMVGKSYLASDFGRREYSSVARFSFLDQPIVKTIFRNQPEVTKVLRLLSSLLRRDIVPGHTLLILDDIQFCPDAVEFLRDFRDDAPSLDILACGTFYPGDGAYEKIPFSAIEQLQLLPFSYKEFLLSMDQKYLVDLISKQQWDSLRALAPKFNDYFKQYCFCGGMPSVVQAYVENGDLGPHSIREMQLTILQSIELHLSKKQLEVWTAVNNRMLESNHKFMFADIKKGARLKEYEPVIDELIKKGLVYRTNKISNVSQPLDYYQDKDSFHLFPLDLGLMGAKLNIDPSKILIGDEGISQFNGAFPRMAISLQLRSLNFPVYHYAKTASLVEIDFIIQTRGKIIALEVNACPSGNTKALKTFIDTHPGRKGVRASLEPHTTTNWMENIPLYAVSDFLSE